MIFEVDSIEVAKGIEYVVKHEKSQDANMVVLLPKDGDFFPEICHGSEWKDVLGFIWSGLAEETIDWYKSHRAILIAFYASQIVIIDIVGLKILELNCSYEDALSYLRYLLYGMGGVYDKHCPFFIVEVFSNQTHNLVVIRSHLGLSYLLRTPLFGFFVN